MTGCADCGHSAESHPVQSDGLGAVRQVLCDTFVPPDEAVHHPDHYGGDTTYEAIKVIEAWDLGFHLGNTVKYICRAGKKGDELEDLRKARWYLDRRIKQLETEG